MLCEAKGTEAAEAEGTVAGSTYLTNQAGMGYDGHRLPIALGEAKSLVPRYLHRANDHLVLGYRKGVVFVGGKTQAAVCGRCDYVS